MPIQCTQTCSNACHFLEYCIKHEFPTITLAEVLVPAMVRDIRKTCALIADNENLSPSKWHEWLVDQNRDYGGVFLDSFGLPKELNLEIFEATDEQIDNGEANKKTEQNREFFRVNTQHAANNNGPVFVTEGWHKHFVVLGSLVGAARPDRSVSWPRLRVGHADWRLPVPANDNRPIKWD
ncbi:MAG: hypothetical protein ABJV68_06855 [Paracoccaceae bacterium]